MRHRDLDIALNFRQCYKETEMIAKRRTYSKRYVILILEKNKVLSQSQDAALMPHFMQVHKSCMTLHLATICYWRKLLNITCNGDIAKYISQWVHTSSEFYTQKLNKWGFKWNKWGFRLPLCTCRLNWARRTSQGWWDEWDDTDSRHRIVLYTSGPVSKTDLSQNLT